MANTDFRPKLTKKQKDEIFDEYVKLRTHKERWGFQSAMAEKFGVHRSTIQRIVYDEKRMKAYLDKINHVRDLAMLHLAGGIDDAVRVEREILGIQIDKNDRERDNLRYLQHQTAESLLKRAGVEAKREEKDDVLKVEFVGGGFDVGMPDRTAEDDEDGEAEASED